MEKTTSVGEDAALLQRELLWSRHIFCTKLKALLKKEIFNFINLKLFHWNLLNE